MNLFCVPSHHFICHNPVIRQGVLLNPTLLMEGIWRPAGGNTNIDEDAGRYRKELHLWRSDNQAEYTAALNALMTIGDDDSHLTAVISMRWCSLTYRLVTSKRVWLGLYRGQEHLRTYSHADNGQALYNFCDYWENPEYDQKVWEARFMEAVTK